VTPLPPDPVDASTRRILVHPVAAPLAGGVRLPGSKSVTNRALLLAALADGTSRLSGALHSDDTRHMIRALREMGVAIDDLGDGALRVRGSGGLRAPPAPLFLGNAGTATRFLTAAAALAHGRVVLDGDEHMRRRPIAPLVDALRALGVRIDAPTGCPPVTLEATGGFDGERIEVDASLSSQYVSALLMLAPCGRRPVEVALRGTEVGARGYIDLTVGCMRAFGARVDEAGSGRWRVAPTGYRPADFRIEPDASAATYLWAAARLTGGDIDLGVAPSAFTQPDARAHALIAAFPDLPARIDGSQIQDAVPTLAVMAAFAKAPVAFVEVGNLRVKECDRIAAVCTELNRIAPGLAVESATSFVVHGRPALRGAIRRVDVETYGDHRIAMSFALAGLLVEGIGILDPACVRKTFPEYWSVLAALGVRLST
jgi:3-phosphoshikimate 1-carboxyvinyltransferase